jgi:hypothetical protein
MRIYRGISSCIRENAKLTDQSVRQLYEWFNGIGSKIEDIRLKPSSSTQCKGERADAAEEGTEMGEDSAINMRWGKKRIK